MTEKTTDTERTFLAIDLKSFYASVECVERGLDPLRTNLVVADASRTAKTICLAVSPSLKAHGISGRARLFEVVQRVREINRVRLAQAIRAGRAHRVAPGEEPKNWQPEIEQDGKPQAPDRTDWCFEKGSSDAVELAEDPGSELSYIIAPPRMRLYMEYSARVVNVYLRYIAPEDIHVYSIDECFIDATRYLKTYGLTGRQLAAKLIREVLQETGITATGGVGSNLYLCKIAMDIMAKHAAPDADGVRIAELDEASYRRELWAHQPLTDFWRVGHGIAAKLEKHQIFTMGDIARCSMGKRGDAFSEDLLYRLFGVNAELLIDHAWGWEPCEIADIKAYRPEERSISTGQVLPCAYSYKKGRLIIREMADQLALDLVDKGLVTDQIVLTVVYDTDNLLGVAGQRFCGETESDRYGRRAPKPVHGSINLNRYCSSAKRIIERTLELYTRITDPNLLIRRVYIVANHVLPEGEAPVAAEQPEQLDLFTDYEQLDREREAEENNLRQEKALQQAMLGIKKKFGKNAILKGMNLEEGGTARERNGMVGGHKA